MAARDRRLSASLTWRTEEAEEEIGEEGDQEGRDQLPELKARWEGKRGNDTARGNQRKDEEKWWRIIQLDSGIKSKTL